MGCNIYLWVEKKIEGKWVEAEDQILIPCSYCDGSVTLENKEDKCWWCHGSGKEDATDYDVRCYAVYSILADVRNEIDGKGRRTPICAPKGLPSDSPFKSKYNENCDWFDWDNRHSYSYHDVKQLKEFDWEKKISGGIYDGKTHREAAGYFYDETIPALQKLSDIYGGDENIRIVFYFCD